MLGMLNRLVSLTNENTFMKKNILTPIITTTCLLILQLVYYYNIQKKVEIQRKEYVSNKNILEKELLKSYQFLQPIKIKKKYIAQPKAFKIQSENGSSVDYIWFRGDSLFFSTDMDGNVLSVLTRSVNSIKSKKEQSFGEELLTVEINGMSTGMYYNNLGGPNVSQELEQFIQQAREYIKYKKEEMQLDAILK